MTGAPIEEEKTAEAGGFSIEVEDTDRHGGHFVLRSSPMASRPRPSSRSSTIQVPKSRSLQRGAVFSSDVHGDATGVLLADAPAGSYVLMCRRADLAVQGLDFAAQIQVTGTPSYPGATTP